MKAKILIVDDDPDIATMLEDRLQASDYGTVIARDGVEALELVERKLRTSYCSIWICRA